MTLGKLYRLIGNLLAAHPSLVRCHVTVFKPTFVHPLEQDGVVYLDVEGVTAEVIPIADGDGFGAVDPKGHEKMKQVVVLFGDGACKHGRQYPCSVCEAPANGGSRG